MSSSPDSHPIEDAVTSAFRPGSATLASARVDLDAAPDDPLARARYLGHLARSGSPLQGSAYLEEALWWIRERPTDLERVFAGLSRLTHAPFEQYVVIRDALEKALVVHGANPSVLRGAGRLVQHHEPKRSLSLLERAYELDPTDAQAAGWIGHQYSLAGQVRTAHGDAAGAKDAARDASFWFERALARAADTAARRWILVFAAHAALAADDADLAQRHAEKLIASARTGPKSAGRPDGLAIHDGNVVLGRIALARGDRAAAIDHLARAGETPGAPSLKSFGPELALANELLKAGERAAVLAYLTEVGRFWKMDRGLLAHWRSRIEAGETPEISRWAKR